MRALRVCVCLGVLAAADAKCLGIGRNVALGKLAFASSEYRASISCGKLQGGTCKADRAVDGKTGLVNRWLPVGNMDKHWLVVDLGATYDVCSLNIIGTAMCEHKVSVWTGDPAKVSKTALRKEGSPWKIVASHGRPAKDLGNVPIEHDVISDAQTRFLRIDFDQGPCRNRDGKIETLIRLGEFEVFGELPPTTTAAPATTQPTTTNTNVQALEQKLQELQESVNSGGNNTQTITKEITLIQGSLKLVDDGMKAQAAEVSALTKSRDAAVARMDALEKVVASLLEAPKRPDRINDGCSDCTPSVEASGKDLVVRAEAGSISFAPRFCAPVDICDLSRDVAAIMDKFGNA